LESAQLVSSHHDEWLIRGRKPPAVEDYTVTVLPNLFWIDEHFIDLVLSCAVPTNSIDLSFIENIEDNDMEMENNVNTLVLNKSRLFGKKQLKRVYSGVNRALDQSNKAPRFKLRTFLKRYCDRTNKFVGEHSDLSRHLLGAFVAAYVDEEKMSMVGSVRGYELMALYEYLAKLTPAQLGQMQYEDHHTMLRALFKSYCKNQVASKYEKLAYLATKAGQGIIYVGKSINTKYSPALRAVMMRLNFVLKEGIYIDIGYSEEQFQYVLCRHCYKDESYYQVENDFEEYDKSQGKELKDFEMLFYKFMGMNEEEVDMYEVLNGDWYTRTNDGLLAFNQAYMRKSGEPATLLGNTVIGMALIALMIDFSRSKFALLLFKGDDSSMMFKNVVFFHSSKTLEVIFGMKMKYFVGRPHYFASRFFNEDCMPMPDPVKFVLKLTGRKYEPGMFDVQIEEHQVAYVDRLRFIRNDCDMKYLALSTSEYYDLSYETSLHLVYVMMWCRVKANINTLYRSEKITYC